jgi:hypothetical protein
MGNLYCLLRVVQEMMEKNSDSLSDSDCENDLVEMDHFDADMDHVDLEMDQGTLTYLIIK